ncbi:MAG: DUF192 domain-containing protein [Patescibacteria group bacterium]
MSKLEIRNLSLVNFRYFICVFYFWFFIFSLTGCGLGQHTYKQGEVTIGEQKILVEVADTRPAIYKGLSGRESLADNQGMLFVFPKSDIYEFEMREMKFSLDIIWIHNNEIVEIWSNAPLPTDNYIPRYRPKGLANYVLEVNAGTAIKYGWRPGDKVSIGY